MSDRARWIPVVAVAAVLTAGAGMLDAAGPIVLAASTFDSDTEGWTTLQSGFLELFIASGGNPGGFFRASDVGEPALWYFQAPAGFVGNQAGAYGGTLSFDLKLVGVNPSDSFRPFADILLSGGGLTLAYAAEPDPNRTFWTSYTAVLDPSDPGWRVIPGIDPQPTTVGPAPTEAQFRAVLASLTLLAIRGDHTSGGDTAGLDNVVLTGFEIAAPAAAIDVKPGADDNSLNPRSKGVFAVALLTGDDFDATLIDPLTVRFGPDEASPSHERRGSAGHLEDVDADGDLDILFHFRTPDTGVVCGLTEMTLTGLMLDGTPVSAADAVRTVGCK